MGELHGKVLVDCTNPEDPDNHYEHRVGYSTSWSEEIASWAPNAKVVKAFNHLYGSMLLKGNEFDGSKASLFYCGDDAPAKASYSAFSWFCRVYFGRNSKGAGERSKPRYISNDIVTKKHLPTPLLQFLQILDST